VRAPPSLKAPGRRRRSMHSGAARWPMHARHAARRARRLIRTFTPAVMEGVAFGSASTVGRGGMEAKVASAWDAAQGGVVTVIANGKKSDVLLKARALCSAANRPVPQERAKPEPTWGSR